MFDGQVTACPKRKAADEDVLAHRIQQLRLQNAGLGEQLPLAGTHDVGRVGVQAPRAAQALDLAPRCQAPLASEDSIKHLKTRMEQVSQQCGCRSVWTNPPGLAHPRAPSLTWSRA